MGKIRLLPAALIASGTIILSCSDSGTGGAGGVSSTTSGNTTAGSMVTSGSMSGPTTTNTTGANMTTTVASSSVSSGVGGSIMVGEYDCTAPSGTVPTLVKTQVVNGLNSPVDVKVAPDNPDRLYVVQRGGRIRIVEGGQILGTDFLNISTLITAGGEQGLLGLAFHPDYANNGRFFVHYSKSGNGDSTVQEFHRSNGDPLVADTMPVALVLQHATAQSNHNGGALGFGDDGFLYISLGDGGEQGDHDCDAQRHSGGDVPAGTENLLGKIARIDVNGAPSASGYPGAMGNPGGQKYYHMGFRNPWRMNFDPCTGDLYVGDVGQDDVEEVDRITKASGPINAGWPYNEGVNGNPAGTPAMCPANPGNLLAPIDEWSHSVGCSAIGGVVYRSSTIPGLRGAYVYGDYCSGDISYKFPSSGAQGANVNVGGLSGFGQDGHGNVYAVSVTGGQLYRIDAQ